MKSDLEKKIDTLYTGFSKYMTDSVYESADLIVWKHPKAYQWLVSIDCTKFLYFWIDNGVLYAKKYIESNQWKIYELGN